MPNLKTSPWGRTPWTRSNAYVPNVVPFRRRRRRGRPGFLLLWVAAAIGGLLLGLFLRPDPPPTRVEERPITIDTRAADVVEDADVAWAERGQDSADIASDREAIQPGLPRPSTSSGRTQGVRASFGFCHAGGGSNCVVDGDTFYLDGQKVRIAGIDAPETHPPRCAQEARLGASATQQLHALLNSGAVSMSRIDRDRDRHGRLLRNVAVDGADVGAAMIGAGVAREYGSGRRSWCG